jgi:hypothetical protein
MDFQPPPVLAEVLLLIMDLGMVHATRSRAIQYAVRRGSCGAEWCNMSAAPSPSWPHFDRARADRSSVAGHGRKPGLIIREGGGVHGEAFRRKP